MMDPAQPSRVLTGIAGLDEILCGGLVAGGAYLVLGAPGAGKTVLGNQACFAAARGGGSAVYVTLMAESHGRLISHMRSLDFFDETLVSTRIHYLSAYGMLEERGLAGLLGALQQIVSERGANLLVVDALSVTESFAGTALEVKKFQQELQFFSGLAGCTVLLLASRAAGDVSNALTLVDGVIQLLDTGRGDGEQREIRVLKSRGSDRFGGPHAYAIDRTGFVVYPRREYRRQWAPPSDPAVRVSFGIAGLDRMLHGGVPLRSSTLLYGPPGAGKTVIGLHFVTADAEATGLYFGLAADAAEIAGLGEGVGIPVAEQAARGRLKFVVEPLLSYAPDVFAARIAEAAAAVGAVRVFIDDLERLLRTGGHGTRPALACLTEELGRIGATVTAAFETAEPFVLDSFADNHVRLRHLEEGGRQTRACSIAKMARSAYDPAVRPFRITPHGVQFEDAAAEAQVPRPRRSIWHGRAHLDR